MMAFFAILCLTFTVSAFCGCAHQADKAALGLEKALVAGSAAVDVYVDVTIEKCRALDLKTVEERTKCVAKADKVSEATEKAMELAVEGLRTYWRARAAGDGAGMLKGLDQVRKAVSQLPSEHFGGLKGLR